MLKYIFFLVLIGANISSLHAQSYSDLNLANAMLLCASHKGLSELVASKAADTSLLNPKLRVLAKHWDEKSLRRDSVKVATARSISISGTKDKHLLLVYLSYKGSEWDEMLLLVSEVDNQVIDIANPEGVFSFDKKNHLRYHKDVGNSAALLDNFAPYKTTIKDAEIAVRKIITLVNWEEYGMFGEMETKEDSLFQYIAYSEDVGKPLNPNDKDGRIKMEEIYKSLKHVFVSPQSMVMDGGFTSDNQKGTCKLRFRCKESGRAAVFYFIKRNGNYLLYKVVVF